MDPVTGTNQDLATIGELSDEVGDSPETGVGYFLHGVIPERLLGILSEGEMRPSLLNIKAGICGVYATKKEAWQIPLSYAYAVPLGNNGVYYQFVLELRTITSTVIHNKYMKTDYVLDSAQTRVNAVRVYVKHSKN